ncbi:MAG: arsenate reductase ArsC [Endomicrobiaceae bacterium]|nr:arsenate reductase ArsC [Endomicrobiaceae bacterium]
MKKQILILCTGNSCRSQIAEGLINHFFKDNYEAFSAGSNPVAVNPMAVKVMAEIGIDISKNKSKHVDVFENKKFDTVITVCDNAKESCPVFLGKLPKYHWGFNDPATAKGTEEEILNVFRKTRDSIFNKLKLNLTNS